MNTPKKKPDPAHHGSDPHELSQAQQNAVDLLAAGKNDTEAAVALGLNRVTVTRWRLYSPEFRASLAERRAAVWGASADRLRALLPKALDALADSLEHGDDRAAVALAVLKLAGPLPIAPTDPIDPEDVVRQEVKRERARLRNGRDDTMDLIDGLPNYDSHVKAVRKKLAARAGPSDDPPAARATDLLDRGDVR